MTLTMRSQLVALLMQYKYLWFAQIVRMLRQDNDAVADELKAMQTEGLADWSASRGWHLV